jgi:hypothetical protein
MARGLLILYLTPLGWSQCWQPSKISLIPSRWSPRKNVAPKIESKSKLCFLLRIFYHWIFIIFRVEKGGGGSLNESHVTILFLRDTCTNRRNENPLGLTNLGAISILWKILSVQILLFLISYGQNVFVRYRYFYRLIAIWDGRARTAKL